ncbi:MAG: PstS family phosphate ABC transporter substrate-binding protein [Actinomycetota bacterium]|nr:PstS family phosphate ABC transporter substrate-binding protein [Actinomycetota bacterium]
MKAKKWMSLALVTVLGLSVLGLTGCDNSSGTDSGTSTETGTTEELTGSINVEGSDTIVNTGQAWAEMFMEANPGVMISVKGGGSGAGIAALINGTVDFANASRDMKQEEIDQAKAAGVDPVEHVIAKDGISVAVNPANPVTNITIEQLGKIYRGEITNWKDVGGADKAIVLLSRDSSSGTYEYFKEAVVGKDAEYAKEAKLLSSNQAIVDEVKGNDAAIGYVGLGYAENAGSEIKVLSVEGITASVDTVLDGTYPLGRDLYIYSNGQPDGVMKAYLDWILGSEGQTIVADQGFVPLQ